MLMGWQFTAAAFVGGLIVIAILVVILRIAFSRKAVLTFPCGKPPSHANGAFSTQRSGESVAMQHARSIRDHGLCNLTAVGAEF